MKNWRSYLERQKKEYLQTKLPADFNAGMIVVIPCYDEHELSVTLRSLLNCADTLLRTMVVVVVNAGVNSSEEAVGRNRRTYGEVLRFAKENDTGFVRFVPLLFEEMPRKHAGVGLARKIGMDLAIDHFLSSHNKEGIIVSLDADCTVSANFLSGIYNTYRHSDNLCSTVHNFSHRVESDDPRLDNAVSQYERHIRYYGRMLRFTGFPYHHHTIGSAFSVAADAYVRVGGMGRQQGGEDFYFLQKVFELGRCLMLDEVFVFPLARFSDRIPFGTGPALRKIMAEPDGKLKTYRVDSFVVLKQLFDLIPLFFKKNPDFIRQKLDALHPALSLFSQEVGLVDAIGDCNRNCATRQSFEKRFFHHFNAFRIVKFLNFVHPDYFQRQCIDNAETDMVAMGI